jgi:hypothetical protein
MKYLSGKTPAFPRFAHQKNYVYYPPKQSFPSHMAEHLIGSEIIKLGNEVNERIRQITTLHR